ncbi:hypothetical protein [[Ruminococcus] torques]|uniref:hypothetical protein n=1 Tax=[Ruminococcus] torques TaxID=33039 RepID=UPI0025A32115|nr:hypothetical protein [[Ruminococcus] torques]MDM8236731.1 hypothetical protein [[Ruminococcus] torques]
METIYGESPEIQANDTYSSGGGISLFSAGDGDETLTGGSGNDGSTETSARYYWSITRSGVEPDYTYSGGITGSDPFGFGFNESSSPFYQSSYKDVWEVASTGAGTLDAFFQPWNESADEHTKWVFQGLVIQNCPKGCYVSRPGA